MRRISDLINIFTESGTAEDGNGKYRPFVRISADASNGDVMIGQMTPGEIRDFAMVFLGAAEAAEQDSIVMTMMTRDVGLAPEVAVNFIATMRKERLKNERGGEIIGYRIGDRTYHPSDVTIIRKAAAEKPGGTEGEDPGWGPGGD